MGHQLTFVPLSDVGRERSENQDAYGSEHLDGLDFYLVCDGMGGHRGGSTASRLAVAEIIDAINEQPELPLVERMVAAFHTANDVIFRKAQAESELHGMGTTAVILAVDHAAGTAHYVHVGDSRLYRIRGGTLQQLTRDHTFVQRLVDDGILTHEAAENHPQSNVIIRSLGGQPIVDVEVGDTALELLEGDTFLLCSDGLHGLVSEEEIATVAVSHPLEEAARILVERANEEGGHDNITVELIRVGQRHEEAPDTWEIVRPSPAPGTRLARKAAEAAAAAALASTDPQMARPDELAAGTSEAGGEEEAAPADEAVADDAGDETPEERALRELGEAPTEAIAYEPPANSKLGPMVLVAVVAAIIFATVALAFLVIGASPDRTAGSSRFPHVVAPE